MTKETKPKKPRVDKERNQAKVVSKILKNPLATEREIAKEAWVSKATAHRTIKEMNLSEPKIKAIEDIISTDATIVQLAQMEIVQRLQNPEKEKTRDIIAAASESAKRYSLFSGNATDENGWLKDNSLNDKQLKAVDAILSIFNKNE